MNTRVADNRTEVLRMAERAVNGAREGEYGSAEDSFGRIAALWNGYFKASGRQVTIAAEEVPLMMVMLKMARLVNTKNHLDSWVDIAGYAACGAGMTAMATAAPAPVPDQQDIEAAEEAKEIFQRKARPRPIDSLYKFPL